MADLSGIRCAAAVFVVLLAAFVLIFLQYQNQPQQLSFAVFQDSRSYQKGSIAVEGVRIPLGASDACEIAREACGSAECLSVKSAAEISEPISEPNRQMFGNFNWVVELKPVCGPTTAFVSEDDMAVVCFCAYE